MSSPRCIRPKRVFPAEGCPESTGIHLKTRHPSQQVDLNPGFSHCISTVQNGPFFRWHFGVASRRGVLSSPLASNHHSDNSSPSSGAMFIGEYKKAAPGLVLQSAPTSCCTPKVRQSEALCPASKSHFTEMPSNVPAFCLVLMVPCLCQPTICLECLILRLAHLSGSFRDIAALVFNNTKPGLMSSLGRVCARIPQS